MLAWEGGRLLLDTVKQPKPVAAMPVAPFFSYRRGPAAAQIEGFIGFLERRGCEVLLAAPVPGCWDQHFVRDTGFVIGDTFFCSRLRRPDRRRETAGIKARLEGMGEIVELEEGFVEGGDVLVHGDTVFVGQGDMTDSRGVDCLRGSLARRGMRRDVVALEYTHRGTIHLDTKFNIIGERLAMVYPRVFTRRSLELLERRFDLIAAEPGEALKLGINCVSVAPGELVFAPGSERLASECVRKGCRVDVLEFDEVSKGAGSFRCATLPLAREPLGGGSGPGLKAAPPGG